MRLLAWRRYFGCIAHSQVASSGAVLVFVPEVSARFAELVAPSAGDFAAFNRRLPSLAEGLVDASIASCCGFAPPHDHLRSTLSL